MRTGKLVRGSDLYKKQKGISFEQMYNIGSITNITQKQTYFVYKKYYFCANRVHGMYSTLIYLKSLAAYPGRNLYSVIFAEGRIIIESQSDV